MTISREDVHALSSGPAPDGPPLPAREADRVAAVLNRHSSHGPIPPHAGRAEKALRLDEPAARDTVGTLTRTSLLAMMARAGYAPAEIEQAAAALPELVDRRVDHVVLTRFSLHAGELMERMGSSP